MPAFHSDIPSDTDAIVTDDGRVFYNLDALVEQFEPRIAAREFAANLTKGERDLGYVSGERNLLEAIRQSKEVIFLDETLDNS